MGGDRHVARSRSTALQYDRYRPESPDELIDELTAGHPTRVLDVGCGTGKVARTLAGRGLAVLGVEVDERMANVARGHGVEVEVAPFETWDDAGRRFDLMTCGDAWHWIDPDAGIAKAARVLATGGDAFSPIEEKVHNRVPGRPCTHSARNHRPDLPTAAAPLTRSPFP
ncbi:methyltransferase domain-containing protein [Nonomuraea angiospora]|uniref:class I SAM-dependent methyltransferase n=1 Tax=Nonomuraea angiospora TaxID=46172 RepID=UPI0033268468